MGCQARNGIANTRGDTNVELYGVGGEGEGVVISRGLFSGLFVLFYFLSHFIFSCFSGDNMETQNVFFLTVQQELVIHYI